MPRRCDDIELVVIITFNATELTEDVGNLIHFRFVKVLPIEDHNEESETIYIANVDPKPADFLLVFEKGFFQKKIQQRREIFASVA